MFEGVQQDSGNTAKANEGLGVTSDESAVTVADAWKDSETKKY